MRSLGQISVTEQEFIELAPDHRVIPVTMTLLADAHTPLSIYHALAGGRPGTFLMESAAVGGVWSRHSFIGVNSVATLTEREGRAHWLGTPPAGTPREGTSAEVLRETLAFLTGERGRAHTDVMPHLSSGLVGYIGWEVVRHWEKLSARPQDDLGIPEMAMNLISDLAVHDNRDGTVTLVANAINYDGRATGVERAYHDAVRRLHRMRETLARPVRPQLAVTEPELGRSVESDMAHAVEHSWEESEYLAALSRAKQAIVDGEVFQIVVSRRFEVATSVDAVSVYRMLRLLNPSPYMYLFHFETPDGEPYQVIGASPEALVTVQDDLVVTHPIAGTRPRGATEIEDQELAADLLADEKERAEHLMLVDLARNDLAKVCRPGSVQVTQFMAVERFSHVMHMTSHVQGELDASAEPYDVLAATFPAGTLSGAPKPRALQLLDAWEPAQRGVYGGVVGYFDLSGRMDMAIAIRSALLKGGRAYVQAGGGIVADSVFDDERVETLNKAAAPLRAVLSAGRLSPAVPAEPDGDPV